MHGTGIRKDGGMDYRIIEGADRMQLPDVVRLLRTTFWAGSREEETIEKSMRNSDCYGICLPGSDTLAGFARVVSDSATVYYICDVVIDEACRGMGLGAALIGHIVSLPAYEDLRGFLITRDARSFYQKFGFEVVNDRIMVRPARGSV